MRYDRGAFSLLCFFFSFQRRNKRKKIDKDALPTTHIIFVLCMKTTAFDVVVCKRLWGRTVSLPINRRIPTHRHACFSLIIMVDVYTYIYIS